MIHKKLLSRCHIYNIMPNLGSIISRHSPNDSNVKKVTNPERKIIVPAPVAPVIDQYAEPKPTTALPIHTRVAPPVFNYLQHLEDAKKSKKRRKIKLLPGEKILVDLEKQLKSKRRHEDKEQHIDMLSKSVKNVLGSLDIY